MKLVEEPVTHWLTHLPSFAEQLDGVDAGGEGASVGGTVVVANGTLSALAVCVAAIAVCSAHAVCVAATPVAIAFGVSTGGGGALQASSGNTTAKQYIKRKSIR